MSPGCGEDNGTRAPGHACGGPGGSGFRDGGVACVRLTLLQTQIYTVDKIVKKNIRRH